MDTNGGGAAADNEYAASEGIVGAIGICLLLEKNRSSLLSERRLNGVSCFASIAANELSAKPDSLEVAGGGARNCAGS